MYDKDFFQKHVTAHGGPEGFLRAAKSEWDKTGINDIASLRAALQQNPLTRSMNLSDELLSDFLKRMRGKV